jgi:hypothetical protein
VKLRIVSNGTAQGTMIYDEEGRVVENVRAFAWVCEAGGPARLYLEVMQAEADVAAESPQGSFRVGRVRLDGRLMASVVRIIDNEDGTDAVPGR